MSDSARLLALTNSRIVARMVDKALCVTGWEKFPADTSRTSLANRLEVDASIAGVELTQVEVKKHAYCVDGGVGQHDGKYQKCYVN